MPLILPREHWDSWLNREQQDVAALAPLLVPTDPARLQAWPVSRSVNRSSSEGEALIEPLPQVG
jgi:putative SOS response-associated peptidase YedK